MFFQGPVTFSNPSFWGPKTPLAFWGSINPQNCPIFLNWKVGTPEIPALHPGPRTTAARAGARKRTQRRSLGASGRVWWLKSSYPVEVGSLSYYLPRVLYFPGGWPWDFWTINSTNIYLGFVFITMTGLSNGICLNGYQLFQPPELGFSF